MVLASSPTLPFPREVFVIPDPQLRLDQVEQVQMQVAGLLGAPAPSTPAPLPVQGDAEVSSPS